MGRQGRLGGLLLLSSAGQLHLPTAVIMASIQSPCLKRCFSFVPMTTGPPFFLPRLPACRSLGAHHRGLCLGPHACLIISCEQPGHLHLTPSINTRRSLHFRRFLVAAVFISKAEHLDIAVRVGVSGRELDRCQVGTWGFLILILPCSFIF